MAPVLRDRRAPPRQCSECGCKRARHGKRRFCGATCTTRAALAFCDPKHHDCTNWRLGSSALVKYMAVPMLDMGLVATQDIRRGAHIIEYRGTIKARATLAELKQFNIVLLRDGRLVVPDGSSPARLVNNSCAPSAELVEWELPSGKGIVVIVALQRIKQDQQVLVHFGWTVEEMARAPPYHCCMCGRDECEC